MFTTRMVGTCLSDLPSIVTHVKAKREQAEVDCLRQLSLTRQAL